jgi:hypothetical protein
MRKTMFTQSAHIADTTHPLTDTPLAMYPSDKPRS